MIPALINKHGAPAHTGAKAAPENAASSGSLTALTLNVRSDIVMALRASDGSFELLSLENLVPDITTAVRHLEVNILQRGVVRSSVLVVMEGTSSLGGSLMEDRHNTLSHLTLLLLLLILIDTLSRLGIAMLLRGGIVSSVIGLGSGLVSTALLIEGGVHRLLVSRALRLNQLSISELVVGIAIVSGLSIRKGIRRGDELVLIVVAVIVVRGIHYFCV
mmetsp:Transcript_149496/g.212567  ORF Transcript_149496/g.212567 Transcript_149496/m.212567 type:complete len:218 (-) Transcript_149496:80-733(-)